VWQQLEVWPSLGIEEDGVFPSMLKGEIVG